MSSFYNEAKFLISDGEQMRIDTYAVGRKTMQQSDAFKGTFYENFTLVYALPLSNHDNSSLMLIAGFYALLFMFGTCGNAAILAVVHHVKGQDPRSRHNTTLTYICILSIVDFLSMLPIPMTIIDQILGFWMFDTFACKLFRLLEHIGKIFSTFILVAFSIDRYCAVCHPLQVRVRNQRTVFVFLGIMFFVTCVMLSPILLYAHSKELVMHEKVDLDQEVITRMHLYKCVDDLGRELFVVFTLYSFVLAYLMPLLFMIYFYYEMLIRLFKQANVIKQTLVGRRSGGEEKKLTIPVGHIAIYTLAICSFHFICWTPYWISILYSLYEELYQDTKSTASPPTYAFIYFMYGVHALPYINSASNFILYGLLNRQLHNAPERKYTRNGVGGRQMSHALTTNTRPEYSELIAIPSSSCRPDSRVSAMIHNNNNNTESLPLAQNISNMTNKDSATIVPMPMSANVDGNEIYNWITPDTESVIL
ncbi:Neuropeptide receptor 18 [Caenorhabditis elegans]|uniref:Neuropeptide receptor 18 n=2 Tax=Caenorhabditis elegans TaxID=6239 RepID=NPR18_CAEEL|nr:Neuropeptide receptor 18 [Caenorhabditis elegans]Q09502.2 RecName: Full=Neuropeptide receptor 18 [Caenorhabditis elegans]CCH63836.1 Neuropeptide receptor 18 [Caenorhabditis elegans]|eukprot:NP_001257085.1 Neuropeptide receptor 18 [Caenorhabditis elegans]